MLDSCFKSWWVFDAVIAAITASKCHLTDFSIVHIQENYWKINVLLQICLPWRWWAAAAAAILRIAYVVRSLYFNFQPNWTIFTMFTTRTAKTPHKSPPPRSIFLMNQINLTNVSVLFINLNLLGFSGHLENIWI